MIKYIYNEAGDTLIRTEEANPICGNDFCDYCGDCLVCNGDDTCYQDKEQGTVAGEHFWVQYGEKGRGE